jgi:hypothetical protein
MKPERCRDPFIIQPGVCRRCGCTDKYACLGGCCWADETQTLCTMCALIEEISPYGWKALELRSRLEEQEETADEAVLSMIAQGFLELRPDGQLVPTAAGREAFARSSYEP